jgi:isopenicillin-N N-acyltransferase-like protein
LVTLQLKGKAMAEFPLIEVHGQPFEMGYQHGAALKDLVALSLETMRRLIARNPVSGDVAGAAKLSVEEAVAVASEAIPLTIEYAPDVVEEMRGIAEGAAADFEEIFALNSLLEILQRKRARSERPESSLGCSSYAVGNGATMDGETYVGWNADDDEGWLESSVLVRGRPAAGLPFLFWNFAGCIGRPGMNPNLGLGANSLYPSDLSVGVPYCVICRKVLQQESAADAVKVIRDVKRMGGMNYTVGDVAGNVTAVETTARRSAVIPGGNGKVIHTNHYVADELLSFERLTPETLINTQTRHRRLREMVMGKAAGAITLEQLKAVHCDHANRPDTVCRHGEWRKDQGMSLAALIMQPRHSRMLVAYGHPCEHPFVEYTL